MRFFAILILKITILFSAAGQDLASIGSDKPIKINGSLNFTSIGYGAYGIAPRRNPLNWFASGGLSFSLYGWNIPFSFSYSNQGGNFQQPFNQYGVTPEYKWIKAHIGYSSMNFSRYSLAGHTFMGGGIEATPGKFIISMMYGRLNKAIEGDSIKGLPSIYERYGYGLKAGYASGSDGIDVMIFKAWDDPNSVGFISEEVVPQENVVMSITGRKNISPKISITGEYALSGIVRLISAQYLQESMNMFNFSTNNRDDIKYSNAFNGSVIYSGAFYNLSVNYERIDPQYTTLGAYYFNNDLENITIGGAIRIFKQKVSINANIGSQKNNLDLTELNDTRRMVSSLNLSFIPNANWNINTTYSNFTTYTNIRPQLDPFFQNELDTLNFYQISQNASATVAYSFGDKESRKSIFFTGSYQMSEDEQQEVRSSSTFTIGNVSYRATLGAYSVSLACNLNRNIAPAISTLAYGPNLNVSRTFFNKKLRGSLSSTFNQVVNNSMLNSKIMNVRMSTSYRAGKKHNLSLFVNMLRKFGTVQNDQQFNEFTGTFSYGYNF